MPERGRVRNDAYFTYAGVERPEAPKKLSNATGDVIVTDGKVSLVQLAIPQEPAAAAPLVTSAPQP